MLLQFFVHSFHATSLQGFEVLLGVPGPTCIGLYSRVAGTYLVQQVGFSPTEEISLSLTVCLMLMTHFQSPCSVYITAACLVECLKSRTSVITLLWIRTTNAIIHDILSALISCQCIVVISIH